MKFSMRLNSQGQAYFPKELRQMLGETERDRTIEFDALVNAKTIVLYRKGEHPDLVKQSLDLIKGDLDLRQLTTLDVSLEDNLLIIKFNGKSVQGRIKEKTTIDELSKAITAILTTKYHIKIEEKEITEKLEPYYLFKDLKTE